MQYRHLKKRNIYISYDIYNLYSFCEKVWERASEEKSTLVVFDEIHEYGKHCPPIETLYRFGRPWNIEIVAISHRFADLPLIVRSQTARYCVFQVTEKCDKDFLKDSLPQIEVDKIANLNDWQYIIWDL